jgi:hypothetical protein
MKSYMPQDDLFAVLKLHNFNCSELAQQFTFMQGGAHIHCFLEDVQFHQEAQLLETRAIPPSASFSFHFIISFQSS